MEEKIAKTCIYLAAFLIPLFFLPLTQNVLDFQKQILLLILVSISLFCFAIKVLTDGKATLNFHPLNLAIFFSILIFGLSTLFSNSKTESFFGFPLPTSESYLTLLLLIFYFLLIVNLFEKHKIFHLLFFFSVSIFLVTIVAILQIFGKFVLPFDFTKNISFNTVGSPTSLAVLLACFLPAVLVFLFSVSKRIIKIFFFFQSLLILFLLGLINVKIAWFLLTSGLILISVFWIIRKKTFKSAFLISSLFLLAISVSSLFLNFSFFPFQMPTEVLLGHDLSFEVAFKSLKENSILGTGPGTFVYNFLKNKGTALNDTIFWNFRFSNSASKFLDILTTTGILGTLSFLTLIFYPLFLGIVKLLRPTNEDPLILATFSSLAVLTISFFLYPANLVFIFFYFLLFACFINLISKEKKEISLEDNRLLTLLLSLTPLLILIFNLGIILLSAQRYAAETYYLKGVKELQMGNVDETIQKFEKAISIYPEIDLYFRDLSQVYLAKLSDKITKDDQNIQNEVAQSINFAKLATELNSINVANWSVRAFTYESLAGTTGGAEDWAIKTYDEAIKLEPSNPYYFTRKGVIILRKGILSQNETEKKNFFSQAEENFKRAIELKSDYAPAHFQLAILWQTEGKIDEAISKLEETKNFAPFDTGLAFQLGLAYYRNRNYQKAKEELERATTLDPNYANALYFLGLTYDKLEDKKLALEKFKKVSDLNPDVEEVKKIISNLEAGEKALEGILLTVPPTAPIEEKPPEIKR